MLEACLRETESGFVGRVCYTELPVEAAARSASLSRRLDGCCAFVVFAATVGVGIDRYISKYAALSPARALLLQALGAERVESLCDTFCERLRARKAADGLVTLPRFSPGYGDFPLEAQTEIFRLLQPQKRIGLTLNESLSMSPSKSVTAIVGVGRAAKTGGAEHGCASCVRKDDCAYRKDL